MPSTSRQVIQADRFAELVRPALGLVLSHAWRGHGSALFLELGRLRHSVEERRDHPRGSVPQPMGAYGVMIQWSWRVERARSIQFGSWSNERRLMAGIPALAGTRLEAAALVGRLPELQLALSDRRWLQSFMTSDGQPEWTFFLCDGSWLTVERGRVVHDVQHRRPGCRHRADAD